MRRSLTTFAFCLAFVVNPAILVAGCGGPRFSEREAVAVVTSVGAHKTYAFVEHGASYELTLDLTQSAKPLASVDVDFVATALACGERTFVKSAAACIDVTRIPVEGRITLTKLGDQREALLDRHPVSGQLLETGTDLANVELTLRDEGTSVILQSSDAHTFTVLSVESQGLHYGVP